MLRSKTLILFWICFPGRFCVLSEAPARMPIEKKNKAHRSWNDMFLNGSRYEYQILLSFDAFQNFAWYFVKICLIKANSSDLFRLM
jgi:hypothetical protein